MDFHSVEKRLARARGTLDRELGSVPEDQWTRKPAAGGWSVAEVVVHLVQVETAVHGAAVRRLAEGPRPLNRGLIPRAVWPPIWMIPYRGLKRESPIPMDPGLVTTRSEMLAKFAARRRETLDFFRATMAARSDLSGYHWRHPFFGELTFAEWCRVLAYHEMRHAKQIREIVRSFQS